MTTKGAVFDEKKAENDEHTEITTALLSSLGFESVFEYEEYLASSVGEADVKQLVPLPTLVFSLKNPEPLVTQLASRGRTPQQIEGILSDLAAPLPQMKAVQHKNKPTTNPTENNFDLSTEEGVTLFYENLRSMGVDDEFISEMMNSNA